MRSDVPEGEGSPCAACIAGEVVCACSPGVVGASEAAETERRATMAASLTRTLDEANRALAGEGEFEEATTPAPAPLNWEGLRAMVEALAPLAELDAIAGLRGRSRDPREHPSSRGEQRDAAAALDAAHDRDALAAGRRAWERYARLPEEAQETARWVALIGAALPRGECPNVEAFAMLCGRLLGPVRLREREEETRARAAACALGVRVAQQRIAREGATAEAALLLDAARSAAVMMEHAHDVAESEMLAWGRARLERLARCWAEVAG
jgi:hypothetical protein